MNHDNSILCKAINDANIEDSVKLLGLRNDIVAMMNTIDIHVLSSSFGEGFPNTVAEAMACGTPCVATDVGDAGLIIGEEGWVVPPQDSIALSTAISAAIHEKEMDTDAWDLRKKMCRKKIANNYSIDAMVDSYKETWISVIANLNYDKDV